MRQEKMKYRILVFGNFGYINKNVCGQTIKTRNIYELFKLKSDDNYLVDKFNTQEFKYSFVTIFSMFWKIFKCNKIVYIPAQNNLKYLFPIIYFLCWMKKSEILYFVVGGWAGEFLKNKKLHIKLLSQIKAILTESDYLTDSLIYQYHFSNVLTFPNFRIHSFIPRPIVSKQIFKVVFMARISKMKGIDYAFKLAEHFNSPEFKKKRLIIDFYGPIEAEDKKYFFDNINKISNISYKGVLQPENIYKTIHEYDLMILPTHYHTEGFPGTILDAYISGLPIVATNWKYAYDFILNGQTGLIVPFENSENDFIQAVKSIYEDEELLLRMKKNAFKRSMDFSSDGAWNILVNNNLITYNNDTRL